MQSTTISWTDNSWNPIGGCSRVSDGCKHCYASALSERYGWTRLPWTVQNESVNVSIRPHKLVEPYRLKEKSLVFVNSMSDPFHRVVPDWFRAAMFAVMLSLPEHTFQMLTKRGDALADWPERWHAALQSPEYARLIRETKDKRVRMALERAKHTAPWPWADNIWMGVSIEDSRVFSRIDELRACGAATKFVSAEPLLGSWGTDVDLSGINWLIVGGESGPHLSGVEDARWMNMAWAREIRDLCVAQGVAFFFKQDSGLRSGANPWLIEEDGSHWVWHQFPFDYGAVYEVDEQNQPVTKPTSRIGVGIADLDLTDLGRRVREATVPISNAILPAVRAAADAQVETAKERALSPRTRIVHFQDVRRHWNERSRQWMDRQLVYIGRGNERYHLSRSPWANPYPLTAAYKGEPDALIRLRSLREYRDYLEKERPLLLDEIEALRGKTLVCWCKRSPGHEHTLCHGDVLLQLLGEPNDLDEYEREAADAPQQLDLFELPPRLRYE